MLRVIFEFLSNLFGFGKAVSTEVAQRDAELNQPDMKANAQAADEQKAADAIAKDVASKDVDAIRKDIA